MGSFEAAMAAIGIGVCLGIGIVVGVAMVGGDYKNHVESGMVPYISPMKTLEWKPQVVEE